MKAIKIVIVLLFLVMLFVPASASASRALCGFECNIEGFDFCIATGNPNMACWQIQGGCISGGYICSGGGM